MNSIPEKEVLFNRYYANEMSKEELIILVKRLLLEKEVREWFIVQMEFFSIVKDSKTNFEPEIPNALNDRR